MPGSLNEMVNEIGKTPVLMGLTVQQGRWTLLSKITLLIVKSSSDKCRG